MTNFGKKMKSLGGKLKSKEVFMRRTSYDYPDLRLNEISAWIRVRDEGNKITMGYKQRQAETVDGM
jgi:hypothetical protein